MLLCREASCCHAKLRTFEHKGKESAPINTKMHFCIKTAHKRLPECAKRKQKCLQYKRAHLVTTHLFSKTSTISKYHLWTKIWNDCTWNNKFSQSEKELFFRKAASDEDKSSSAEQAGRNYFNSNGKIPMTANTTQRAFLTITLMNLPTPILCGIRRPLTAPRRQGDFKEI